jgi:hypothetical protein
MDAFQNCCGSSGVASSATTAEKRRRKETPNCFANFTIVPSWWF